MKSAKILVSLALVVGLSGCDDGKSVSNSSTPSALSNSSDSAEPSETSSASQALESSQESSPSDSAQESDSESLTKKFGSTFTWDDKVAVTISEPKSFTPSEYAATDSKFKKAVVVEVVLKNGSPTPYSPMDLMISASSGDQQSDGIFDSEQGVDGSPSIDVMPGKSLRWKQAFGVDEKGDLTIKVENGFDNAAGYYTK